MGMFDYVKYKADCFNCGATLEEARYGGSTWQTKSAKDDERLMRDLEVKDVAEDFYTDCDKCGAWNEYDVSSGTPRLKEQNELDQYQRITTTP